MLIWFLLIFSFSSFFLLFAVFYIFFLIFVKFLLIYLFSIEFMYNVLNANISMTVRKHCNDIRKLHNLSLYWHVSISFVFCDLR